jgi:hypothetical protein
MRLFRVKAFIKSLEHISTVFVVNKLENKIKDNESAEYLKGNQKFGWPTKKKSGVYSS